MENVQIQEDRTYTIPEVIELVQQTLERVSAESQRNELRYSATDVYWLLHDMLRYINRNVPGEFKLIQTQKGHYRVRHTATDTAKQKSHRRLKAEINRTARYLEDLTGRRPTWGEKEE